MTFLIVISKQWKDQHLRVKWLLLFIIMFLFSQSKIFRICSSVEIIAGNLMQSRQPQHHFGGEPSSSRARAFCSSGWTRKHYSGVLHYPVLDPATEHLYLGFKDNMLLTFVLKSLVTPPQPWSLLLKRSVPYASSQETFSVSSAVAVLWLLLHWWPDHKARLLGAGKWGNYSMCVRRWHETSEGRAPVGSSGSICQVTWMWVTQMEVIQGTGWKISEF